MTFDEIVDLAVDENFSVYLDHTGDLATVKGRAAFEQELIIRLTERLRGLLGRTDVDSETLVELARSHVEQIVAQMDELDRVASFDGEVSTEQGYEVLEITLTYDTGDVLEFEVEQ